MDTETAGNDNIIDCPQCSIKNPIESDICYKCGASLHEAPVSKKSRSWIPVILISLFAVGLFYFFYSDLNRTSAPPAKNEAASVEKILPKREPLPLPEKTSFVKAGPADEAEPFNIPIGMLQIRDVVGKLILETAVPVVAGGWIAVPTRQIVGGYSWILQMDSGARPSIEGGIVDDQEQISLWRIREDQIIDSPDLYPWSAETPMTWMALRSADPPERIDIGDVTAQGNFMKGAISDDINEAGVFIQTGRVVGWTFGDPNPGAFLWIGEEGRNLKADIRVDDYYRLSFANSREEEFVRALALGDEFSNLDRLEAFTRAFRFEPRLSPDQTPDYLKPEAVISQLRLVLSRAAQESAGDQAASYFDAEILAQAGDISLMLDVVALTAAGNGPEDALNLMETASESIAPPKIDQEKARLNELHSGLYQSWLNELLDGGDIQEGWQVYARGGQQLPDDLNIYLFGVRLALAEGDWETAERLLAAREYPPAMGSEVRGLQSVIAELKGQASMIVIRFVPGTRQIPVTASLNQDIAQDFIVDTGASMVTIPFSTVRALGIVVSVRNPRRKVYTASGELFAPEIVLDSITLEGYEINNVKALVMDLPNQPNVGLLGLNYLRRFRMDLNTDEGVLMLAPK
ncbi:MAG: retroviral-like aspartic protease family protein [Deltaproteobacteria bacterium]|jgi:clan AA aspartic protease (TIGR02281 family)|nr:retroviral-like aspartic protease family protein [Deltaproteobacteria bacterium]